MDVRLSWRKVSKIGLGEYRQPFEKCNEIKHKMMSFGGREMSRIRDQYANQSKLD